MTQPRRIETPVVLILFNRPELTQQVLAALDRARPTRLFVVADGPRPDHPEDLERCAAARAAVDRLDWDCQVDKNYADVNLGLRRRVVSGLQWVFDQAETAIVLEDDCIADPTFFTFCDELLDRYGQDERVMAIAGTNFQRGRQRSPYSYYFSRYNHCWGWATWRRAWRFYDDEMSLWPLIRDRKWLEDVLDRDAGAARYWRNIFQAVYDGRIHSWAYRWTFACWVQSGLTALPNLNLISNVGFGEMATHTRHRSRSAAMPTSPLPLPLKHPPFVIRDIQADRFTQSHHFAVSLGGQMRRQAVRLLRALGLRRS